MVANDTFTRPVTPMPKIISGCPGLKDALDKIANHTEKALFSSPS
jgi:hypothetical protein